MSLKTLDLKDVTEMVKDHFPTFTPQQVDQFAPSILDKSMGMPFFIQQMLTSLSYESGRDSPSASSPAASNRLSQVFTTENLLEGRMLANLPNDLVAILIVASFLTNNFNSTVVARFLKRVNVVVSVRN